MARRAASSQVQAPTRTTRRSTRASTSVKGEEPAGKDAGSGLGGTPSPRKRVKKEESVDDSPGKHTNGSVGEVAGATGAKKKTTTSERKLAALRASLDTGPFPDWPRPSAEEALRVAEVLTEAHGYKSMPVKLPPKGEDRWGGCGDVASVLDATVRTILSCNTSGANSRNAHRSLCERFGKTNWKAMLDASHADLADSIRCGGLHEAKAKTIQGVLRDTMERHGKLSLDHLHQADSRQVMEELVSFNGVGPKVASCVSAFCIGKEEMAVDTHVHRLCKKLGWVPEKASRDQTYYHLYERIPGHLKYPLHVLLIKHGKACSTCSARGFATDRYQSPAWKDEGMSVISGVKEEDIGKVKEEDRRYESVKCPLQSAGLFAKGRALKREEKPIKDEGAIKQEPIKAEIE